jgi:peptidoglycan-N-acetylglucosamine deacetylase
MVDADTVFAPETIGRLVQPFADPTVGAVAGNLKVGNRGRAVTRWQHIEYVIGFNLERRCYDALGCIPTVPGAVGAFRRSALAGAGGMSADTLAEDTDLTMTLLRLGWRVVYEDRARAWTEAPATLRELFRQRLRWTYGTIQAMWKHRGSVREQGASGRFGRLCLPVLAAFGVLVPLLSPVVDAFLLYALIMLDAVTTATVCLVMLGVQLGTALVAFRLDGERPGPLWELPVQQLVLRHLQWSALVTSGVVALAGGRLRWRRATRHGLDPVTYRRAATHAEPMSTPPREPGTIRQEIVPAA